MATTILMRRIRPREETIRKLPRRIRFGNSTYKQISLTKTEHMRSVFVFRSLSVRYTTFVSGRSLVAEHPPSKRKTGVRFSPPALETNTFYLVALLFYWSYSCIGDKRVSVLFNGVAQRKVLRRGPLSLLIRRV